MRRPTYKVNVAYDGDFNDTRDITFDKIEAFNDWINNVNDLLEAGYRKDVNIEMDITLE
jgi:hypothetical protein